MKSRKIGLGCVDLRTNNNAIIDYAIEKGVTLFDTADCYGNGESEKALGQKLIHYARDTFYISSKCGVSFQQDGIHVSGTPHYIQNACDASLARLQTNYIDLYYLHRVDPHTAIETSMTEMAKLVTAGKIKHIGLSEVTENQLRRAHKIHPIAAIQIEYAPWSRQDEHNGVIAACKELGVDVVAYSPLGRAFFTGNETTFFENLPASDFRKYLPRYNGDNLEVNMKARTELQQFASSKDWTLAQLVLAWEMNKGMSVIPATTNKQHLDENLSALSIAFTDSDVSQIEEILTHSQFVGLRYPAPEISGIYPEQEISSILTRKNILMGLSFITAIGGLFAYSRYRGGDVMPSHLNECADSFTKPTINN